MDSRAVALRFTAAGLLAISAGCTLRKMDHSANREARIPIAGATVLKLNVGAGYLRVEGHSGITDVAVSGIAHAASSEAVEAIQLSTRRVADTIFVTCTIPSATHGAGTAPSLDVTIQLPSTLALQVSDSNGESVFRNVAALRIAHGDGGLDVDSVAGDLDIIDGGGDLMVANVTGNVHIIDGAGSIYLTNINGSVSIPQDGSGEVQLVSISGDVTVGTKRSGEVAARGVGGNLAVTANGSGSIEYRDVKGRVSVPPERYH